MRTHELKCWPANYEEILVRNKTADIRYNEDRQFQKGDVVMLREWDPKLVATTGNVMYDQASGYSGRRLTFWISHVQSGTGIAPGYVMLSWREFHEL